MPRHAILSACALLLAVAAAANGRELSQASAMGDPASWVQQGIPQECTGQGNSWERDDIDCRVCNGQYLLDCDEDDDNSIECEFGRPGGDDDDDGDNEVADGSEKREWSCPVDSSMTPWAQCNWSQLQSTLPDCAWEPVRRILAGTQDPADWIDPSGQPDECSGSFFRGNQWAGDEIECHVCPGNEYQLKCDLDTDLVGDDSAKCEFGRAGLSGAIDNAREFDCVLDTGTSPPLQCDWSQLQSTLPGCAWEPVRRIMATWNPVE